MSLQSSPFQPRYPTKNFPPPALQTRKPAGFEGHTPSQSANAKKETGQKSLLHHDGQGDRWECRAVSTFDHSRPMCYLRTCPFHPLLSQIEQSLSATGQMSVPFRQRLQEKIFHLVRGKALEKQPVPFEWEEG